MRFETRQYNSNLIIAYGGLPGVCTAIQTAWLGLKGAFINDRGVLGGNESCEIAVPSNGTSHGVIIHT